MKVKLSIKIFFLVLYAGMLFSQSVPTSDGISRFVNDRDLHNANISISVIDIENNELVAGHRPHKVLVPASSLKLLTSLTALKHLKPDATFNSQLSYDGEIRADGTLEGNIYFIGSGDPTFGSDRIDGCAPFEQTLSKIVSAIKSAGINCIKGQIIIDESVFDSYPVAPSWQWNDLGNYYASGAWGVNVNENLYYVHFGDRMLLGSQPSIEKVYPYIPGLNLSNEITIDSAHTGDNAYIFGGPYNDNKRIVGTIPQGKGLFTIKGSIPDPPSFLGYHIARALDEANIQNEGYKTQYHDDNRTRKDISEFASPSILEIVRITNFKSLNLHAECLLKKMGLQERGQGSGQNGIAVINSMLRKYQIPSGEYNLEDGSGLSARNQVSSFALSRFLSGISNEIAFDQISYTIPKGGVDGNVRSLFKNSPAKGKLWLKSGSMGGIQSYTGYIQTESGQILSFSIIANGFSAKGSVIRRKMATLIESLYYLK